MEKGRKTPEEIIPTELTIVYGDFWEVFMLMVEK